MLDEKSKNNHIENYNNEEFQYDMYHNDNYMNSISSIAWDMSNKLYLDISYRLFNVKQII